MARHSDLQATNDTDETLRLMGFPDDAIDREIKASQMDVPAAVDYITSPDSAEVQQAPPSHAQNTIHESFPQFLQLFLLQHQQPLPQRQP